MDDVTGILIRLDNPLALLTVTLSLLLLITLPAWLGYRRGYRQASLWRTALAHLSLGLVVFDNRRRILFQNDSAAPLLKQLDPGTLERVHQAGAQGSHYAVVARGDDSSLIDAQAWALGEKDEGVVLTLRDTVKEREQQQQAAANYRKFIHTLSHELYKPLLTIQLQLGNAANSNNGEESDRRQVLQVARTETDRLIRLVSDLLTLSRLESSQPLQRRLTKINSLAEEAMAQLFEQANARQIMLMIEAEQNLPPVAIDNDAWRQLFLNLIDNGIKYGKAGGTVRIEMRQQPPNLHIIVADDGPGIPPDEQPHLFKELFRGTSSRHFNGSGLGLAIVRRIVEQHGGQIRCDSEPDRGATFHVTLPLEGQIITKT
jgi:two-component system sensor histidine kinase VicK